MFSLDSGVVGDQTPDTLTPLTGPASRWATHLARDSCDLLASSQTWEHLMSTTLVIRSDGLVLSVLVVDHVSVKARAFGLRLVG